jgi:redox-sensitive bicupin YhaK (pirin superfamily)
VISGQPINEPSAWGGPFVMNTREEVLQAFDDFQNNRF